MHGERSTFRMQWLGRWSKAVRIAAVGAAVSVPGCFRDQPTAIDRTCFDGENTCPCREGDECNAGLTCMADGRCRDPRCNDGRPGCACVDGVGCDPGLECRDKSCLPPEVGTSSDGGSTPPSTTEPPVTSGPSSDSDPLPGTTFDPSITDSSPGTDEFSDVGPGTFDDSGMGSTGTVPACHCGWRTDVTPDFYACGLDVLPKDPAGVYPLDCPDGTWDLYVSQAIEPPLCSAVEPPINDIG